MTKQNSNKRSGESGNVLFLILIAVALFAALSYAVTQSTRTGGGSTENETNALSSASIAQYPATLRTSVVRMILNGVGVDQLEFNPPSNFFGFGNQTALDTAGPESLVFHPSGGGGVYQTATDVSPSDGNWYFNADFEIPLIGIDGAGGNDLIAFLPGISSALCTRINEEVGLDPSTESSAGSGIPTFATTLAAIRDNAITGNLVDAGADGTDMTNATTDFNGQPTGCFQETGSNEFVFYSVLLER
ncbi:MAG: hypothetical protein AAF569_06730 [Pseudomonadota bacterium]